MSTCLHRFTPDTNLVQTKIGAVETFAKLFFGKSKPFSVIFEPSYLGFSEEICRIFQPPPLTYHAYYAPHTPYTNLLGHHFGSSSGLAWFGRFGPVWVESAPRWTGDAKVGQSAEAFSKDRSVAVRKACHKSVG